MVNVDLRALTRLLTEALGYMPANGLVPASDFVFIGSGGSALRTAASRMNVVAAFGLRSPPPVERFRPLVLLAEAGDDRDVVDLHRRAWSQGAAPYLLVVTPTSAWQCDGFSFASASDDATTRRRITWEDVRKAMSSSEGRSPLPAVSARTLRSMVSWRDYSLSGFGVDKVLLTNLDRLSDVLTGGKAGLQPLSGPVAHALMGRMIYLYMLVDRQILSPDWFSHNEHDMACLLERHAHWPVEAFHSLNKSLDKVFNGAIFPIAAKGSGVTDAHLEYLRSAIRLGRAGAEGEIQLELFEIDLALLRVETLSAVYELFLAKNDNVGKRKAGAFYTPPFLVDFVLDAIEDRRPIRTGSKVLDPACGSGVFLVGAYRRMIETALLEEGTSWLPISRLKFLLQENVFGAELEEQACQVAAFSLYITMLDYASSSEVVQLSMTELEEENRIFPRLIPANIWSSDFFEAGNALPSDFDVVVGNPPWSNALQAGVEGMAAAADRWKAAVENAQSAQVFVLETLANRLRPGGVAGYLLPIGTFTNDAADKFRRALIDQTVVSVTSLAPFRRELFEKAEQAAAILIVRRDLPGQGHQVRFDSPTAMSQPVKKRSGLWMLTIDPGESASIPQAELVSDAVWTRALNGRAVDRLVMRYLDDLVRSGRATRLGRLLPELTVKLGAEERYSGVPTAFTLTARKNSRTNRNNYLSRLRPDPSLDPGLEPLPFPMPEHVRRLVKRGYRALFLNDVLVVPRAIGTAILCTSPVSFNTTLIGVSLAGRDDGTATPMLVALERFLNSRLARYWLTLQAPSAMNDRPRLSNADLAHIPVPFAGISDARLASFLAKTEVGVDAACYGAFGIKAEFRSAIDEFLDYRLKFANAKVPVEAFSPIGKGPSDAYVRIVRKRLTGLPGGGPGASRVDDGLKVQAVEATLVPGDAPDPDNLGKAIEAYQRDNIAAFSDSLFVWRCPDEGRFVVVKPIEAHHWTVAQAFTDAERIASAIMRGPEAA